MKRASLLLALLATGAAPAPPTARFAWVDYRGSDPVDARVRVGPQEYRNPILQGFHPDPAITQVGRDYYLVTSSFAYFPGLPIFHSRDLVSWTQIGNAIDRPKQLDFGKLGLSRGVFAPDISHRDGLFYIANTCVDCGGNFVITARNPAGPWSDPHWNTIDGIDPALFFDTDGTAWILNNGPPPGTPRYDGHRAIWLQRFDTKTLLPFGPRTLLVDGGVHPEEKPIWAEGPHIFRREGYYYLMTAEGGTAENHSQVVYRSRTVTGPYAPDPNNPILTQRGLDPARRDPITSAGHADFVTTPSGEWWASFLATRPYKGDFYNIGRETFLLPVRWTDGWPRITAPGEAIPYVHRRPALPRATAPAIPMNGAFHVRDDFSGARLPLYWMQIRNPVARWHTLAGGALHLQARPVPLGSDTQPSYLGRRLQHRDSVTETDLTFAPSRVGDRAGLAILQDPAHFYTLTLMRTAGGPAVTLARRDGEAEAADGSIVATAPYRADRIRLRIVMRGDRCDFLYAPAGGTWRVLAKDLDATLLSTKHAGGFVGATVGPFAQSGTGGG